ncbi:UNVERIFIED_CONTAM: hypothetical protein FKN15_010942 [Acipenser sinensis]
MPFQIHSGKLVFQFNWSATYELRLDGTILDTIAIRTPNQVAFSSPCARITTFIL